VIEVGFIGYSDITEGFGGGKGLKYIAAGGAGGGNFAIRVSSHR